MDILKPAEVVKLDTDNYVEYKHRQKVRDKMKDIAREIDTACGYGQYFAVFQSGVLETYEEVLDALKEAGYKIIQRDQYYEIRWD